MRNRNWINRVFVVASLTLAITAGALQLRADDKKETKDAPKNEGLEAVKALAGTWTAVEAEKDKKPMVISFRVISNGSTVVETMNGGCDEEMVNLYAVDNGQLNMTHYCAMGNQPHLKLSSIKDGVLKFEYVSAGNLTSRDQAHMDSLEITVKGYRLIEKWNMYKDGKVVGTHTFELKKS